MNVILTDEERRIIHASNAALRQMKHGRKLTGYLGNLSRLTKLVKTGKKPIGLLVEWWELLATSGKDSPARHVHPRHKRATAWT